MASSEDSRVRTALALALLKPCLLCGGEATTAALFHPYEESRRRFGVPEGKTRFYSLWRCLR